MAISVSQKALSQYATRLQHNDRAYWMGAIKKCLLSTI